MGDGSDSSGCFCKLCSLDFTTHRVSAGFACLLHEMRSFDFFHDSCIKISTRNLVIQIYNLIWYIGSLFTSDHTWAIVSSGLTFSHVLKDYQHRRGILSGNNKS